jgi:hypothetical protein
MGGPPSETPYYSLLTFYSCTLEAEKFSKAKKQNSD